MMATTLEILQQNVLDYFRISFMVSGHTKFAPDLLFSVTARDFYASDIFNERELVAVMEQHASVVVESGRIVQAWKELPKSTAICLASEDYMISLPCVIADKMPQ